MCNICKSDKKRIWAPVDNLPELEVLYSGNWIQLLKCPNCNTLWVASPFEPYASFTYFVQWNSDENSFITAYGKNDSKDIHKWMKNEIMVQIVTGDKDDKRAYKAHNNRSYGHYGFDKVLSENPISIYELTNT